MTEAITTEFNSLCKTWGIKCTPQRWAVYKFIHANTTHPDVDYAWEYVRKEIPSITRESVYRILNEFTEYGLIYRMDQIGTARYDSSRKPHGHFICKVCNSITDFELDPAVLQSIGSLQGIPETVDLRISGICDRCKANL